MAIRKVARLGHPVLREVSRPLRLEEFGTDDLRRLITDMIDTMKEYGGIGLAAPQIHESLQLAIIGFSENSKRYPKMGNMPLTVVINPRITVLDEETQGFWEGCLSVPGIRGLVYRPRKIKINFLDENGNEREIQAEDFLATVFQHELDHLAGVIYVDRVEGGPGKKPLAFQEEYEKYLVPSQGEEVRELTD